MHKYWTLLLSLSILGSAFTPSLIPLFEVDETTCTNDYYDRTHKHSFSYQGVHYIFYIDSDCNLVYRGYKGEALVQEGHVADEVLSFADFAFTTEGKDIYLAYASPVDFSNYEVFFVKGELAEGAVAWGDPVDVGSGDRPFIELHNGRPLVVYTDRKHKSFRWIESYDMLGEDWGQPQTLLSWTSNEKDFFSSVYSLWDNGLMFIYWHGDRDRVYAVKYGEGVYSDPVMLFNCFEYGMEYQYFYYCWDAAVNEGQVYFLNPAGEVLKWSPDEETWSVDKVLRALAREASLGLALGGDSDMYFFSLMKESGDLGYYRRDAEGWGEFINLTKIQHGEVFGTCNRELEDGVTGIRLLVKETDSVKILYGLVNLIEPLVDVPGTVEENGGNDGEGSNPVSALLVGVIAVLALVLWQYKNR